MVKVLPLPSTDWRVELNPEDHPFKFPTKGQAISFAIAWGDYHQPCKVEIFDGTGALQRDIALPNGNFRRTTGPDRRRKQVDTPFPDRRQQERRESA
jgi:hypothetical protein